MFWVRDCTRVEGWHIPTLWSSNSISMLTPQSLDVKSPPSALLCLRGGRISVKEGGTGALRASKTNIKRLKSILKHAGNKYRCIGQGCFQKVKRLVNANVKCSVKTIQSGANGSVTSLLKVPSCRGRVGPSHERHN